LFRFAVGLKKLERGLPFIVKRGDLAIDNRLFDTQRFQGVDELGVIVAEIYSVTRNEPHIFTSLKCKGSVTIKLHFVQPIASRKIPNHECLHGLNEGKVGCFALFHSTGGCLAARAVGPSHSIKYSIPSVFR
jgi:hypothetical protein